MPIRTVCPSCGAEFDVRDELTGKKVRCTKCQGHFVAGGPSIPFAAIDEEAEKTRLQKVSRTDHDGEEETEAHKSVRKKWGLARQDAVPVQIFSERSRQKTVAQGLIIGLICLVGLALFGGLGVLGYFIFVSEVEEPVTREDLAVLLTAEKLAAAAPGFQPQPGLGKTRKVRERLGAHVLRYQYGNPDTTDGAIYLECTVTVSPRELDAQSVYLQQVADLKRGPAWEGKREPRKSERPNLLRWGNDSTCIILMRGLTNVGYHFTARKDKRVCNVILLGHVFKDENSFPDLLTPILQQLNNYNP